ncbi:MAG: molybdopterin-dependent oxidoreductase [Chloroflexi bacterium]|nr:molybdopterin-dependent oxidoreductase [Chloroflexota bacterium]
MIGVVAARTLEMPQSHIVVGAPDTANELAFPGTSSQRTTVQMGTAVHNPCLQLKRELASAATRAHGGAPEEWRVTEGLVTRGEQRYTFGEIVQATGATDVRREGANVRAEPCENEYGAHDHWSPAVAAVEIEVDRETGEIRLIQVGIAVDAG